MENPSIYKRFQETLRMVGYLAMMADCGCLHISPISGSARRSKTEDLNAPAFKQVVDLMNSQVHVHRTVWEACNLFLTRCFVPTRCQIDQAAELGQRYHAQGELARAETLLKFAEKMKYCLTCDEALW
jgi:hypothetical protein